VEKCTDCDSVFFVEDLLMCERVVENFTGFGIFGAVDYYL